MDIEIGICLLFNSSLYLWNPMNIKWFLKLQRLQMLFTFSGTIVIVWKVGIFLKQLCKGLYFVLDNSIVAFQFSRIFIWNNLSLYGVI